MSKRTWNRRALGAATASAAAGGMVLVFLPQERAFGQVANAPAGAVLPQATAASPQGTPVSPQATPAPFTVKFYPIDPIFKAYYDAHDGPRILGGAISPPTTSGGRAAQYFEKARLEDWRDAFPSDPQFQFQYGLLVDEMKAVRSGEPVGGDVSSVTYSTIQDASDASQRVPPPANTAGPQTLPDGSVFIPFTSDLSAAPGHKLPSYFWTFINRPELFPGGWLHDIGLPITEPINATVNKGRIIGSQVTFFTNVPIVIQAFQRTILTYDPGNPPDFTVERANTGTDFVKIFRDRVPQP